MELHASAVLHLEKELLVLIEYEAEWASKPM
jgi:hypothetical protein